jgi:putative protease
MAEEAEKGAKLIGKISHFFGKISVAAIELSGNVKVGDTISIKGATTDFEQRIDSMQIENKSVEEAGGGDAIGIKVVDRVRPGDEVFLLD